MTALKKLENNKEEYNRYEIQIEDYEVELFFGCYVDEPSPNDPTFGEGAELQLFGSIVSPILKKATEAKVTVLATPELDDWKETHSDSESLRMTIGSMGSLGDNKTLWFECMIPTHIFYYLVVSVMAGTINFVFLTGETIEQSEGMIVNISFATRY